MRASYVRVNFLLPEEVYHALKVFIPERKRSKVVTDLIREEITKREEELYRKAKAVEMDDGLNREMKDWDITLEDGLGETEWK